MTDLPPDIKAAADEIKAARPVTRMKYAEDIRGGDVLAVEKPCTDPLAGILRERHEHGIDIQRVLQSREDGGVVGLITVDEAGEEHGQMLHHLQPVRVVVTLDGDAKPA